jgi:hypothetical protein
MFSPFLFLLLFVAGGGFAQQVGFRPACDLRAGQLACVTFCDIPDVCKRMLIHGFFRIL